MFDRVVKIPAVEIWILTGFKSISLELWIQGLWRAQT